MPAGLNPSSPPPEGVFISGLKVNNAFWDSTRSVLIPPSSDSGSHQNIPILWVKPITKQDNQSNQQIKYSSYQCPVYCSADPHLHGDHNVVAYIPLPTLENPTLWQHQRVFLSSYLPDASQ
ncbi:hypothetical protein ACJMK2_023814 [Sinanodonta woodiana]|uniref:Dynein heavy chain C-terminal domain-containing protein n=1 Tax=Sinanodonta woodiana TaxID=1069815 RepID=A0ABD3T744_SINWO